MRQLVLLRAPMGGGKSTFIMQNNLEQYTLSADDVRLLFQSPVMDENGGYTISAKNDGKVWEFLFQLLEARMQRGEFTIIDATHSKTSMISRYKQLASRYRYRVTVIDFSDVDLETLLKQNKMRPSYKHVPEQSILNMYERMTTEAIPSWVNVIKPQEYKETIEPLFQPINLEQWEKIHHIGDIHGCYNVLMEYLNGGLKEDELYIFTGDLLDRGIQNGEVLKFFLEIAELNNVIILEGNHEASIWKWANNEELRSQTFKCHTQPELEAAGIDKKDVRQLYRRFRQMAYYTYHGKTIIVTHGGISALPEHPIYMATDQFINGVGTYEMDIDFAFDKNTDGETYQIHGHRNLFRLPTQASERSFNLEGQVEKGGHLRVVTLTPEGFETHELRNTVFKLKEGEMPAVVEEKLTMDEFLDYLQNHKLINEKPLGDNISSFNFSRKAFEDKIWDDINVKARGLFINTNTKEIVNKSYSKFFNINERSFTKISKLADSLVFPVSIYNKTNGYLGILGYNSEKDELIFSSKSEINGGFAVWFKEVFYTTFTSEQAEYIKQFLKEENSSLTFEVILSERDQHIIEYEKDEIILLDIVDRNIVYSKKPYADVLELGARLGVKTKKLVHVFDNWTDLYRWYRKANEDFSNEMEGYVWEDSNGFMTKMKLPYYNFWKQMRGIKDKISRKHGHMVNTSGLYTPLHNRFFAWAKQQDPQYLRTSSIVKLRKDFYSSQK